MRLWISRLALAGTFLLVSACSETVEMTEEKTVPAVDVAQSGPAAAQRRAALTKSDIRAVTVDAEGVIEVEVTIREGKADAGTYTSTSTSEEFYLTATAARDSLPEPGPDVSITVDSENRIVS